MQLTPFPFRSRRIRFFALSAALFLAATASGCWMDGPVAEAEEAEILFGSSAVGGGTLLIEYDFGIPVAVEPDTEIGGFALYSATDPGFVSLAPNEELDPLSPLDDGIAVGIEVTAIDEGVQIVFDSAVLAAVGDTAPLGTTPIHVHPQWQLILPVGVEPTPHFVTFKLTSPDYADSPAYTATIESR